MSAKVKVAVRVRPMNKREKDINALCIVDMENNQTILHSTEKRKSTKTFAFDHCFWTIDPNNSKYANQEQVFQALGLDILDNAFDGYNACIFAYGQTGSGKSYTMMGSLGDDTTKGIIPRLCDTLFEKIAQRQSSQLSLKVEVSYMEIYCEKVKDLLCLKGLKSSLKVREHKILGPYVENLSKLAVSSFKDINALMSEGNKSRTVAATQMNTESSRSHAVFSIVVTQTNFNPTAQSGTEKVSKISLVDLAGSERVSKTGAFGDRLKEGSLINKSLTTLGLVISALADISAGKKAKNAYIPYRDSTLTWLLKDNLGGNSKTVMLATISPASENFEETLSTLRYADRAKRIVNHAVVNEDPNSRVIRELREEVEKLRSLIGTGGEAGGSGIQSNNKGMHELQERLKISEGLMAEMSKSWEQRLAETERIHHERQKALEDMGISVQAAGIGVQVDKYYMVNLNADPSLNELLVCYLKPVTRVGRAQSELPQDIQLRGLGIANEHCVIEIVAGEIYLTPIKDARTLVNGVPVTERVQVKHGGRILLGNNHLYRLSCPHTGVEHNEEKNELMDYEQAMKEISINELTNDPVYSKVQETLTKKHEEEKEGALAAQRVKYEEQLAKLKEQLDSSNINSPTPPKAKYTTLEEEWEKKNRERLIKSVLHANRLVQEANLLANALHKDTVFKVTLTVPRSYLSPTQQVETQDTTNEVAIRVLHKQRGTDSVWTTETLEEKVLTMREMYEHMEEGGSLLDESIGPDPFYDLEQHALLGVANFYLDCINHDVMHDYSAPIVAPTGKVCGKLRATIQRVPTLFSHDEMDAPEIFVQEDELELGSPITVQVRVLEASGLPKEYSHYVFCQYQFWKEEGPMIIPPLVQVGLDKLPEKLQHFDHLQTFTMVVSDEFLDFIDNGALSVEVWGHRRSGFNDQMASSSASDEVESLRHKSFPERWSELTRHIELVVEMMELNEQGEYMPVEIQSKPDVLTGGVFMIRQGQSRRINVVVREIDGLGSSPLKCDHISLVSVGSMYLRNRYDEPLDSLQGGDLERLRTKWSNALMNRREYLDEEVRKTMDKREQSVSDLEKQNELLDQWAMLQWQRAAVLQPKVGSGVPGAPSNWNLAPGFEAAVPVLFLDLNGDFLTPCDEEAESCVRTGQLFGEKPETMIRLPIISSEDNGDVLQATASWDSTVHNTNSLNKITGNNDRVYGIIQVGVTFRHPPGLEVILRKRICLRVYKKISLGATLMRAFSARENRSTCGVLYEVVTGIPKSEGMDPPPKIPANPSFVELDKNENAVEKFKMAMTSVSSILHLDRLKQDVALKEKLTVSGKSLHKRITVGEATTPISRADSGTIFTESRGESPMPSDTGGVWRGEGGQASEGGEVRQLAEQGYKLPVLVVSSNEREGAEEGTTVGTQAVLLSNGSVPCFSEAEQQVKSVQYVPEEALGVGGEGGGVRLDVIPEVEAGKGSAGTGLRNGEMVVGGNGEVLVPVESERGGVQLSENPETGQSEVEQEEVRQEVNQREQEVGEELRSEVGGGLGNDEGVAEMEVEQPRTSGIQGSDDSAPRTSGIQGSDDAAPRTSGIQGSDDAAPRTSGIQGSDDAAPKTSGIQGSDDAAPRTSGIQGSDDAAPRTSGIQGSDDAAPRTLGIQGSDDTAPWLNVQLEDVTPLLSQSADEEGSPAQLAVPAVVMVGGSEDVVKHKPPVSLTYLELGSLSQPSSPQLPRQPRSSSPTPSTESESSSVAEGTSNGGRRASPPPCSLKERVMVELGGGFKMGVVKYIGETEFAPGEWIGVSFDKPFGKHSGTVKGVKYFKCKEKHGVFVKRDKIIHHPGGSPGSLSTKPGSPLSMKRRITSNPQLGNRLGASRRTSHGPSRR